MSAPLPPCLTPSSSGTRLAIHVVPRASKSEVCGLQGDTLKIRLQAPPVDGKANKALCAFIAERLGIPARDVQLIAGETSRQKTLLVPSLPPTVIAEQLGLA